ncbi:hypothetical protein J6590_010846 [Homalodisca vitripennis]|nr:hypothetical protein J6590_010846 [Homalodisca vitripennis]
MAWAGNTLMKDFYQTAWQGYCRVEAVPATRQHVDHCRRLRGKYLYRALSTAKHVLRPLRTNLDQQSKSFSARTSESRRGDVLHSAVRTRHSADISCRSARLRHVARPCPDVTLAGRSPALSAKATVSHTLFS